MLLFGHAPPVPAMAPCTPGWSGIAVHPLAAAHPAPTRSVPQLLTHHLLLLTSAGHGTVELDFVEHSCRPGTLLRARPGQALRFGGQPGLDATIISWDRELRPAGDVADVDPDDPTAPVRWQLTGEDEDAIISEFSQLAFDCRRHAESERAAALLRYQLAVLLVRIALLDQAPPAAANATLTRFRNMVERQHAASRRVEDYADQLGCSVRTLTRASLTSTGRTAKQIVDDRVALEAKRLLAGTALSVAEVGRRLGFGEPTNFGRFFHREVGRSPGAFRAAIGSAVAPRIPAQRRSPDPR